MISWELLVIIALLAFVLQLLDASAGMGYGTLTPILLLLGLPLFEVIPAVIATSAVLSLFAGALHHGFDNIDFTVKKNPQTISILVGFGIIAIIIGTEVAIHIPENVLKTYIGLLIITVGISLFFHKHTKHSFSWKRLIAFASLASFNKGTTGGGYGPVLAGGQILSGVKSKEAVSMTALSEGIVSTAGFLMFLFSDQAIIDWSLIIALLIGGALSTPIAAFVVRRFHTEKLKRYIAVMSILLGVSILIKLFI